MPLLKQPNQIAIIGTGAVGGYYGGLLQKSGRNVHFLLNHDYNHVKENGLLIESPKGDFILPKVNVYNDPKSMPRCDIIIVALKTTVNDLLANILPPLIKEDSIIVTLQNGIGSESQIAKVVGGERVLGGLCFLCSNKIAPGHIRHLDYGLITLGAYRPDNQPAGKTPHMEQLHALMKSAGITIQMIDDLPLARWKKLIWNIPFNGLAVIKNLMTDELVKDSKNRKLCKKIMQEIAMASAVCARPIDPGFIEKMLTDTERMKPYAPSMKLDFDRGNAMEVESIYATPLRIAESHGISMPETKKLYHQLLALNPSG